MRLGRIILAVALAREEGLEQGTSFLLEIGMLEKYRGWGGAVANKMIA